MEFRRALMLVAAGLLAAVTAAQASLPAAGAGAERIEGIVLPHRREVDGQALLLSGAHLNRWKGLFKVSVGALWLPPGARAGDALSPAVARHLEMHYLVAIEGRRLSAGSWDLIARNAGAAEAARLRPLLAPVVDAFTDVAPGDSYALTFVPGRGVTLARNGRVVARVPRDDVAAPLFSVWLGRESVSEEGRRAMLALRLHRNEPGGTP